MRRAVGSSLMVVALLAGAFAPHLVRGDAAASVPLQIINLAAQAQRDGSVLYRVCVLSNPDTIRGNVTLTPTTAAASADVVVTMAGLTCGVPNSYLLEGTQTFGPSAQVIVYQLQQVCVVNSSSVACLSRNEPLLGFGLTVYPDCSTDFTVDQSGAVIAPTVLTPCLNGQGSLSSTMPSPVTATPTATPTLAPPTCVPATATSTPSSTDTAVASSTATAQPASTGTAAPSSTSPPPATSTDTPLPAPTNTDTDTPQPTNTAVAPPTNTSTPAPTSTSTALPTATPTPFFLPTSTATPQPTNTSIPLPTSTNTALPTSTNTPTPTSTRTPTPEVTLTTIPLLTPTKTPTRTPTSTQQASAGSLRASVLKARDAVDASADCSATSTPVPATATLPGPATGSASATAPAAATAATASAATATATATSATIGATAAALSPASPTPVSGQLALTPPRRPARPSLRVSLSAHLLRPGDVLSVHTRFVKGAVVRLTLGYAPHRMLTLSGHADRQGALALRLRIPAVSLPHGHGTASLSLVATAGKQRARFATRLALSDLIMRLSTARIRACAQVLTLHVAYFAHAAVQFTVSYLNRARYHVTVTAGRNGLITRQISVSYLALKPARLTLTALAAGRHGRERNTQRAQLHVSVPAACRGT